MRTRANLPKEIQVKGLILKPVMGLVEPRDFARGKARAKSEGKHYRMVYVMSRNLTPRDDFHGNPYKPTKWLFVEHSQIEHCENCGTEIVFERETIEMPPEYDICNDCGGKFCPDCVQLKYLEIEDDCTEVCRKCFHKKP